MPLSESVRARTAAFFTVRRWYCLNSSLIASLKHTALPAMTCISGPPWVPGKTALFIFFLSSSLHRIIAPRGPLRVLCVVLVTTSA